MESIQARARTLIDKAGIDRLVRHGEISHSRWQSVRYKDIRMSTEELEVLQQMFPNYRLWLISGEVMPEVGQVSPEYDEANRKLAGQGAG
ncbi:hypothetical protein IPC396_00110 [Pseudomonas aeruginosa]|nr:hypothetical protein [Pseudomonas aeruginosa]MCO1759476.1 hypothetical protein [Pseudomonas aeruginosa]MCO4068477.1 hypothetical protein [Pseudomonas aeruginosa]MDV6429836.1 hypothetical protein [Pseudomonas aeruginosa]OWB34462.1 hypothetical protein B0535_27595 [Pseudomonas aeruginosa]RUI51299.1 hypothetical protein IPC396_00110 [Pseudomonas aeruginosa]